MPSVDEGTKPDVSRLYRATSHPALVEVPAQVFLMIDGTGDPNTSPRFQAGLQALFSVGYTLRFALKRAARPVFRVGPLEGLWWGPDPAAFPTDKAEWRWTLMVHVPDEVRDADVEEAVREVAGKKDVPAAQDLRREVFTEGLCAQVLHRGPFDTEGDTIRRLHDFIADQGLQLRGRHHEIYLSDARRTAPERWRTVLRQPVAALTRDPG